MRYLSCYHDTRSGAFPSGDEDLVIFCSCPLLFEVIMKNLAKVAMLCLVSGSSIVYADGNTCQTEVTLKNQLADSAGSGPALTVNLASQGDVNWSTLWNEIEFAPLQSTQSTMTYPKQEGDAPQTGAAFTIHDGAGGFCA